jgi:predicted O-methyltransferase YrrM
MKFTTDWFSQNIHNINHIIGDLKGKENLKFLEIGSYEGLSTVWFLENILTHPTSTIDCFDVFSGDLPDNDFSKFEGLNSNYYNDFLDNVKEHKEKVKVHKGYSYKELRKIDEFESFDFIYIDGAHTSFEILTDAILVEPLLKIGGIILFDDYLWGDDVVNTDKSCFPKMAIDSFMSNFNQQYEVIFKNWQVALRKTKNIHIYN